ncbi:hypothetical protein A2774_00265 [Candidatus Roizmanbacteria bacterium RIFCSPHIGHO2_01_FULL_39_12c]|uniref:Uncharacterized protein n=1 Tax=Candidatus Roizmanbacteria bacterium RIFCSPHIGHO2_01_FULL_39_12c TaxID=1802031 RepID=A0A1F7GEV0_9BACT|nr:MAG: hypothetical protein A2774_00265 [Candidatus Roizmanbacteria bacterium RIFCSPHIGHO2_01_FULL_39_12c]
MTDQNKSSLQQQPKSVRDQVALLGFLDNLIKEKNDPSLTPEKLPQVKAALLQELNEMINSHMVKLLSEDAQRRLDAIFDRNASDEEIDDFFINNIPILSAEIASVLLDFRAAYLYPLQTPTQQKIQERTTVNIQPPPPPAPAPVDTSAKELSDALPPAPVPMDKVN